MPTLSGDPIRRKLRFQRGHQRWKTVRRASRVAMRVVLTVYPRRLELATGTRTLLVHGATDAAAHIAHQPDTTRWAGLRPEHGNVKRADLHGCAVRNCTAGRGTLAPKERHTKIRAAGAAREAGIVDRHGR